MTDLSGLGSTSAKGDERGARWVPLALFVAIIAISFAAPLFRKAAPTHPLVSAGLRLAMASALLTPWLLRARRRGVVARPLVRGAAIAGLFYGLHFGAWVWSLELTTVAASVTLVTATPLLLALVGLVTGRDRPTGRLWGALALACVGVTLIGGADLGTSTSALVGDGLALLGAAAMAGYMLVGRRLGHALDVGAWSAIATGVGAATLLGAAALSGLPLVAAHPWAWLWLFLSALLPQLVGHTLLTWCLRHVSPAVVAMATVAEPVGASLLAWLWLGETVSGQVALGSAATIAAVLLAIRSQRVTTGSTR